MDGIDASALAMLRANYPGNRELEPVQLQWCCWLTALQVIAGEEGGSAGTTAMVLLIDHPTCKVSSVGLNGSGGCWTLNPDPCV